MLLIPRANPIINDTPTKLAAPLENASVVWYSPSPSLWPKHVKNMIITAINKNDDAISGKAQPLAITPQIIMINEAAKRIKIIRFLIVNVRSFSSEESIDHISSNFSLSS